MLHLVLCFSLSSLRITVQGVYSNVNDNNNSSTVATMPSKPEQSAVWMHCIYLWDAVLLQNVCLCFETKMRSEMLLVKKEAARRDFGDPRNRFRIACAPF
ncbi:hypothetical protein J4Q44_G00298100 [Coregonus suidteri]|uniref:Secreted protein n=1 Tax=Coregonus suidteri TaxID=861788 RepID=A0AAN8KVW4_9TELE